MSQRLAAPVLEVLYLSPLEQALVLLDLKHIKTLMYPVPPRQRAHPRIFLVFWEPAERNANAMLAKSFHIYEAHTWAQRYSWVPRELGGGDRGELRIIQSVRDDGRGSHFAAKGADSISAATRGHFTRRVRVLTRAERRDRSRRTAPPLVSPSSPGQTHNRTQSWLGGDNVRRHENQTRRMPPAGVMLNWLGKVTGVLQNQDARVYICHTWFIDLATINRKNLLKFMIFKIKTK